MTVAFVGGTGVSTTGAAKGTTSTTVAYNNVAAGRGAVLTVGIKPNTGTITDPSGWTKVGEQTGGTGTNAADTGQTKTATYYRVLDGTETGSVTINATGSSIQGAMDVYSKTQAFWDISAFVAGSDASHGTNHSAVCGAWSGDGLDVGSFAHVSHSGDTDDSTTATSAPTITQSGITFGTITGRSQVRNTSGNQGMTYTWSGIVTAVATQGVSNIAAPTVGFTWSVSSCGPSMVTRLREYDSFTALTENFSAALSSTKWTTGGTVAASGGVGVFNIVGYSYLQTAGNYYFPNSSVVTQTTSFPTPGSTYYAGVRVGPEGNGGADFIGIYYHGDGTISFEQTGTSVVSLTLDAVNHAWTRIRHDGTQVYLETSPDGSAWTTQRTITSGSLPAWINQTGLEAMWEGAEGDSWSIDNINLPPAGTSAPAGAATGTGSASDASVAMSPNADVAIGSGVASDATVATLVAPTADVATGSSVASDGQASVATNADVATGVGSGQDAATASTINADVATATGQAAPASATVLANAEAATGSGSALDATVTTVNATLAPADLAAGVGTAPDAAPLLGVNASAATASGTAQDALSALQALPPSPSATGSAFDAATDILAGAAAALGLGSALDATVSTATATSAPAETPEAVGTALGASVTSSALAEVATASGSALDASVIIGASAAAAAALGSALDAIAAAAANAGAATGAGQALDASVNAAAITNAPAEVATASGQAPDALVAITIGADVAMATGQAPDAAGSVASLPAVATGVGAALDASVSALAVTTALAEVATSAGTAGDAAVSLSVFAAAATGLGLTDGAVAALGVPADLATSTGQAYSAVAALGALALLAQGVGEAFDLDTGGHTSAPTARLVTETKEGRALVTMTRGPLISQTQAESMRS